MEQLKLPAIPVQTTASGKAVYLTAITYGGLVRMFKEGVVYVPNDPTQPDLAQREFIPAKVKEIARYVLLNYRSGTIYFAPICINICPAPSLQDGHLMVPYSLASVQRLTDGQHRVRGIQEAIDAIREKRLAALIGEVAAQALLSGGSELELLQALCDLQIGVQVYAGLKIEEERQAFRDQNLLATRPGTTLCHAFDSSTPAVLIARQVAERCQWFSDRVEMAKNTLGKTSKLLTLSTLVTATKFTFPVIPAEDAPYTDYVEWAISYWNAAGNSFKGEPWGPRSDAKRAEQRQTSLAVQAITFQALGKLANDLRQREVQASELDSWLHKLGSLDWQRSNDFWIEKGIISKGATGTTISNTRAFVDRLHLLLRDELS